MPVAPCGSWWSPLTAEQMARGAVRLSDPIIDDEGRLWWSESRPYEGGRVVVMRDGTDMLPPDRSARSRVHEYGGRAYVPWGDRVLFVDADAQGLWIGDAASARRVGGDGWRLAEPIVDARRRRVIATGERLREGQQPQAAIVAIGLDDGRLDELVVGADFYAAPAIDAAGNRMAYLSWNHPHMPWDAAAVHVATLDATGAIVATRHVAGDPSASAFQPGFAPDGTLIFVWETSGYWNLYAEQANAKPRPIAPMSAELGLPLWWLGVRTWGFVDDRHVVAACVQDGIATLVRIDTETGRVADLGAPWPTIGCVATARDRVAIVPGWGDRGETIEVVDLDGDAPRIHTARRAPAIDLDDAWIPPAQPVTIPTTDGDVAHGFFYAPRHPEHEVSAGERPPLVVLAHGGPTGATLAMASPTVVFFTSRGFAVLDVNYRGSTGYGRAYREKLRGRSGIVEIDDVCAGARAMVEQGRVDPTRLIIRGASAGGYIVLGALAFADVFHAGASYYGVSEVESLFAMTHKLESHYHAFLLGTEDRDVWRQRSPLHAADRIACPVIFLHGRDDPAVPVTQAHRMFDALRARGIPTELHVFDGEGHGFRRAQTVQAAWTAELSFYTRVLGLPGDV